VDEMSFLMIILTVISFIGLIVISIFIPFLATFQNANFELETFSAKLLFFFVAFENGFFWKEFFNNRCQEKGGSLSAKKSLSI
jgi:predicted outer membrane repeat protein